MTRFKINAFYVSLFLVILSIGTITAEVLVWIFAPEGKNHISFGAKEILLVTAGALANGLASFSESVEGAKVEHKPKEDDSKSSQEEGMGSLLEKHITRRE